jgi:hypothetical protein
MDDLNPYASPAIIAEPANKRSDKLFASRGCWRQDRYVVTTLHGILPSRCVKTGEPAVRHQMVRMTWYPTWSMVYFLLGPLFFIPLLFVGRTIHLEVPVGQAWERRKRRDTLIGVGSLAAFAMFLVFTPIGLWPIASGEVIFLPMVVSFLITIIMFGRGIAKPLYVQHANSQFVWLSGAGEPFLEKLPLWPGK